MKSFYVIVCLLFATFTIAQANTPISSYGGEYPPSNPREPRLRPFGNAFATAAPTGTPTPTGTSTPTPAPSATPPPGTVITSEVPLPMATMHDMRAAVDTPSNYPAAGFPWTQVQAFSQLKYTRGFPTSSDANETQYQALFGSGLICPTLTLSMGGDPRYNTDTSGSENWNLGVNQWEQDVAGMTYAGGFNPPTPIANLIACTPAVNGTNEFDSSVKSSSNAFSDTVNGIAGYVALPVDPTNPSGFATGSSAWGEVIPSAINSVGGAAPAAGTSVTMDAPGTAGLSCGANSAQYFMCPGNWIYIWDNSTTGEHIQITAVNSSAGTITFTPQAAHSSSAILTTDIPWDEAEWQYAANLYIRSNSTHPELAGVRALSTIAFSAIYNSGNGNYGPVSAVDEAFQQQNGGLHLWSTNPANGTPFSDSLHYHTGECSQYPMWATGGSNVWFEMGAMLGQLGVSSYPWSRGVFTGENIFAKGPSFGDGSAVPYVPMGASQCGLPEAYTAQYMAEAPYTLRQTMPWEFEVEPGPYIGWDNPLVDAMYDAGINPLIYTFVDTNTRNFYNDTTTGNVTPTAINLINPDNTYYCTTPPNYTVTNSTTFGPTGCNIFHDLGESRDGTIYTMGMQQMAQGGLMTISTSGGQCTTTQYGCTPGVPIPSPNPTISAHPWSTYIQGMKQAKVYQLAHIIPGTGSDQCDKPTSTILAAPTSAPSPVPTATPNISVANNSHCGDYVLVGTYSTTGAWLPISVTPSTVFPTYKIQMSTVAVGTSPLPTITPVPMPTPNATPAGSIFNRCAISPCSSNVLTLTGT